MAKWKAVEHGDCAIRIVCHSDQYIAQRHTGTASHTDKIYCLLLFIRIKVHTDVEANPITPQI